MVIKINVMKVLHVLAYIIFIGLCIQAGGTISNAIYSLAIDGSLAGRFWNYLDLSNLYDHDKGHFFAITCMMSIVALLNAILFYLIIKILDSKNLDVKQPFSQKVCRQIFNLAYITIGIGLFAYMGTKYTDWQSSLGVLMPITEKLGFGCSNVWLFMGITLLVIAQIFKRGVEIQEENNLTI